MAHSVLHWQASPDQKVKEVTHWLLQALDELLEGWDSTEGESYAERYHVRFQLLFLCMGTFPNESQITQRFQI